MSDDSIRVNESIAIGQNIRPAGEQIQKDEKALKKGTYLNPGAIGYIATLGLVNH
jgi:molybdopterin molybdotransferase